MNFVPILQKFEKERGWVKYQIESFNNFVDFGMQKIINEIGNVNLSPETEDTKLTFDKVSIGKPSVAEADGSNRFIFPNEARIRNLTYMAPVHVKIIPIINGVSEKPETVHIGDLPVMVKSKLCLTAGFGEKELIDCGEDPEDPGGYFIINGNERVLVLIEEIASNRPIFEKTDDKISVRINSERSGFKQRHIIERKSDGEMSISFANIRKLPIIVLMKALGIKTDRDICNAVSADDAILNELYVNLFEAEAGSVDEAIDMIGKKLRVAEDYRMERVNQILDRYLLPHVGQETKDRMAKAEYIGRIIRKLISIHIGTMPDDDIDHYSNKRLLVPGELLGQLFRSIMLGRWGLLAKMTYNYQKLVKRGKSPNIQAIIEANAVTKQILSSLATGNWVGGRTGVSQRLDRSCYVKTVSHLRSVVSPLTATQEHFKAREIHPTEWGRLCPAETPEGSSIGLRKHLALMAEITPGLTSEENDNVMKSIRVDKQ
jgi:DNA-directed RNA polymerase subunit B